MQLHIREYYMPLVHVFFCWLFSDAKKEYDEANLQLKQKERILSILIPKYADHFSKTMELKEKADNLVKMHKGEKSYSEFSIVNICI